MIQRDSGRERVALARAPLALQIFHHLLGRGVFEHPRLSRPLFVIEKKKRWKARQKR